MTVVKGGSCCTTPPAPPASLKICSSSRAHVRGLDRNDDRVALGGRQRRHLARQREVRAVGVHLRELLGAPALLGDGRHQAVDVLDQLGQLDQAVAVEIGARQRVEHGEGEDAVPAVALVAPPGWRWRR